MFDWESGLPALTIEFTEGGGASRDDGKILIAPIGYS
jgi:hypothetical protein